MRQKKKTLEMKKPPFSNSQSQFLFFFKIRLFNISDIFPALVATRTVKSTNLYTSNPKLFVRFLVQKRAVEKNIAKY